VCSRLGSQQEGSVKRAQLLKAGVGPNAVKRRAKNGYLHRVHRGVYIVGHLALAPHAEEFAALLACGERSLISHRSAAHLWSMLPARPDEVDVTLVGRRCRPKQGVHLHLVARIDKEDVRPMDNLLLTAPARTLADFAADAEDDELEAALSQGRALKLIKNRDVEAALGRAGNRRGVARLRRLLRLEGDSGYTQSRAEREMRRLMRGAGLPQPLCNRWIHGYRVDFVWPEHKLVVEVDGYQFHGHRSAFERDRKKDQILIAAGYRVIRITWLQLQHEPLRVAAVIAAALTVGRTRG
jgi:very-short-patch-repair endonuclease